MGDLDFDAVEKLMDNSGDPALDQHGRDCGENEDKVGNGDRGAKDPHGGRPDGGSTSRRVGDRGGPTAGGGRTSSSRSPGPGRARGKGSRGGDRDDDLLSSRGARGGGGGSMNSKRGPLDGPKREREGAYHRERPMGPYGRRDDYDDRWGGRRGGDDRHRGGGPPPRSMRSRSRERRGRGSRSPPYGPRSGRNGPLPRGSSPGMRREEVAMRRMRREREEQQKREREDEQKKREVEEARRDDLTVLVLNMCLKAEEKHIYEFFSANAGKIRDIQLIRDQRSGSSKGVAYVEFYTQESVIKAMALNGISFKGQPLRVQASMAEKNRAARAAKQGAGAGPEAALVNIPMRVYVGGLVDNLSKLTEDDLRALFSPFGRITEIELPKDANTGTSRGYGFVVYASVADAHEAMQHMNGFELLGQNLRVGYAADGVRGSSTEDMIQQAAAALQQHQIQMPTSALVSQEAVKAQQLAAQAAAAKQGALLAEEKKANDVKGEDEDSDLDDADGDKGLIHGRDHKQALMQKLLNRDAATAQADSGGTTQHGFLRASMGAMFTEGGSGGSRNVVLNNMFLPKDANLQEDPDFFLDLSDDVRDECRKFGSVEKVWINEKNLDGKVWIKFAQADQAQAAFNALNGRYFAGKPISVEFVSDPVWSSICG